MKRSLILLVLLALHGAALASPANCDNDMTEDQRFQADVCSAHLGCRLVMQIMDSCISVKSFVNKLGVGGKGSAATLNDAAVDNALRASGVPTPGLGACTYQFDRQRCSQYLGLSAGPPAPAAPAAPKPTRRAELIDMVLTLDKEHGDAKARAGDYRAAANALDMCATAKDRSDRRAICEQAQQRVDQCNASRDSWYQRKATVLKEGATENMRGMLPALPHMSLPPCPTTLPGTSLTPAAALGQWEGDVNATNERIARCDQARRDAFAAIGTVPSAKASALIDSFGALCRAERASYASDEELARKQLAEAGSVDASLPKRDASGVDGMFGEAIAQADGVASAREAQARRAQEAKEQAAADARAAAQRREQEQQEFRGRLQQLGAGELFALADRLDEEGKGADAQLAFRALVGRFPDHALAATAAQRLGTRPARPAAQQASTGSNSAARAIRSCEISVRGKVNFFDVTVRAVNMKLAPPESMQQFGREVLDMAEGECRDAVAASPELKELLASVKARMEGRTPAAATHASNCKDAKQAFEQRMRIPGSRIQQLTSATASLAAAMWITKEAIDNGDKFCKNEPTWAQERAALQQTYDSAATSCGQLSTRGSCEPTEP